MTPEQFLRQLPRQDPAAAYLFLGPEQYRRRACKAALLDKALPAGEREQGYARHDLEEVTLDEVLDDARGMSLFATQRVIWVGGAEAALPRGRAAAVEDDDKESKGSSGSDKLAAYLRDPSPGLVLVFDAARYDFDGEDKARIERVRKFYSPVQAVVEFARPDPQEARLLAQEMAAQAGVRIGSAEIELLVEATASDPARMSNEIEKLALFRPGAAKVTVDDLAALVPNAQESTIFALVNALARGDRKQSLVILDSLVREGEYLPLALTFLGGIFRMALAAKEANLRSSQDVQNHFQRLGVPMWRARADQIWQAASRLSTEKLVRAIDLSFQADRAMKSTRPDDRTVLEDFLFRLTA
jgi:DNA polymerase III subunit delta